LSVLTLRPAALGRGLVEEGRGRVMLPCLIYAHLANKAFAIYGRLAQVEKIIELVVLEAH
jgi:hypothetical protein